MENLLQLIKSRQSSRGFYDPNRPISKADLYQILEAASWAPTAHNMQNFEVVVVEDKELLEKIGAISYPVSETFLQENYAQLSFSEEELLRKKTGLLHTRFPAAMTKPDAKPEDITNDYQGKAIQSSAALLVVLYNPTHPAPASEGDFLGIISLGCALENMWLMAHSLGIGLQLVSALSDGPMGEDMKAILNIPKHLRIAYSCRLGYPLPETSDYLRVRREVDDFLYVNQYQSPQST